MVQPVVQEQSEENATNPDPDSDFQEEVYHPNSILQDIVEDTNPVGSLARYLQEKNDLIGTQVAVTSSGNWLVWTVRTDVTPKESPEGNDYGQVGLAGFDFNNTTVKYGKKKSLKRINFLPLVSKAWAGNWKEQLRRVNLRIRLDNKIKTLNRRRAFIKIIREMTDHEFFV